MKDSSPSSSERLGNAIHKILWILVAEEKTPRRRNNENLIVIGGLVFLTLSCLLLNAIVFLPSGRLFELSPPLRPKVSDGELALLIGGVLSGFLLACLTFVGLLNLLNWITITISKMFRAVVVEPVVATKKNFVSWIINTGLWKWGQAFVRYFSNIGQFIGIHYILYPALPYLELNIRQPPVKIFAPSELPPIAYSSEQACDSVLERYGRFIDILIIPFLLTGVLSIGLADGLASMLIVGLTKMLSVVGYLAGLVILAAVCSAVCMTWASLLKPVTLRRNTWAQCKYENQARDQLAIVAKSLESSAMDQLQASIERMRDLYARESLKTQQAVAQREEVFQRLTRLASQAELSSSTKEDIIHLFGFALDQRRREDSQARQENERKQFYRGIIKDIAIATIFLVIGRALSK